MTQQELFPNETDFRSKLFDFFLCEFTIFLFPWDFERIEQMYPNEYKQFLESLNQNNATTDTTTTL
jgi:hypothetical protein